MTINIGWPEIAIIVMIVIPAIGSIVKSAKKGKTHEVIGVVIGATARVVVLIWLFYIGGLFA